MMEIIQLLTDGITGISCGVLLTFVFTNLCKAGNFGFISKWINKTDQEGNKSSGRVLLTALCFSIIVNILQAMILSTTGEIVSHWMVALRSICCALMASGGYEYVKTIVKNLPDTTEK